MQVPRGNTFQKKVTEAPDSKNGRQFPEPLSAMC